MPYHPPEICPHLSNDRKNGHAYKHACRLPAGHSGDHELRPAHRLFWELREGVPVPAKFYLMPRDEDWANLDPTNWELVSAKRLRQSLAVKHERKTCRDCQRTLSISEFAVNRNVCSDCWKEHLKKNTNARRDHVAEFNCVLVDGQHHHLLTKADVLRYWATDHLIRLRSNRTTASYHRSVLSYRKMLHNAISTNVEA